MAEPFPDIMTDFLAQASIAGYFAKIERCEVRDVAKGVRRFPFLSVWVTDNLVDDTAGDGKDVRAANYVIIAAKQIQKLGPPKDRIEYQDEAAAELAGIFEEAVKTFVYNKNNIIAEIETRDWFSDESEGPGEGSIIWIEMGLNVFYEPA